MLMGLMDTPACVLPTSRGGFAGTVNKADLYDFVKSLLKGFYTTDAFVLNRCFASVSILIMAAESMYAEYRKLYRSITCGLRQRRAASSGRD